MTNEAKVVELTNGHGNQRRFAVADTPAITKGSILKFADARTASQSNGTADKIAGIASMDKVASDGSLSISVWTDGVFDLIASGAIVAGEPVESAGIGSLNYVRRAAPSTASGATIIGYALETAADEEVINVRVRL